MFLMQMYTITIKIFISIMNVARLRRELRRKVMASAPKLCWTHRNFELF